MIIAKWTGLFNPSFVSSSSTAKFYALPIHQAEKKGKKSLEKKRRNMDQKHVSAVPLGMDSSSLRVVKKAVDVSVEPGNCMAVERAVDEHLKQMVMRHSEELDGVPLSFCEMKILQNQEALVHPYFPFLQIRVSAKFSVFSPKKGMKLVGVVKRITNDMICLSVLDMFPAVLHRGAVTKKLQVDTNIGRWVSAKDPSYVIEVGTTVVFTLESVNLKGGLFSINGSLKNLKEEGLHQKVAKRISKRGGQQKRKIKDEEESNPRPKKRKRNSKENEVLPKGGLSKIPKEDSYPAEREENGEKTEQKTMERKTTSTPKKKEKKERKSDVSLGKKVQVNPSKDKKGQGKQMQSDTGEVPKASTSRKSSKKSKDTPKKSKKRKVSREDSNSGRVDVQVEEGNGADFGTFECKKEEEGIFSVGVVTSLAPEPEGEISKSEKKRKKKKSKKNSLTKE